MGLTVKVIKVLKVLNFSGVRSSRCVAGTGIDLGKVRRDQGEIGGVQTTQQIVERPCAGRLLASRLHPRFLCSPGAQ